MAFKYNTYNDSLPTEANTYLVKPVMKLLDKNKNKKILDVGCGNGYLVRTLVENGFDAYGLDASPSGIEMAKKYYPDRFVIHNIEDENLPDPFDKITFDTIISTEVIEHLYSPEDFIAWIKSVLGKSKGQVIISTPYHGYLKNLIVGIFNLWDRHFTVLWEGGHIKFYSRKTLTQLLNKYGFEVTHFMGCKRPFLLWKAMILKAELK